jgi:hypothetical protein
MPDPNLRLLEEAATKLAAFLHEIVFVGGVTLGLLITDKAAAPIRSTDDVDPTHKRLYAVCSSLVEKKEAFCTPASASLENEIMWCATRPT